MRSVKKEYSNGEVTIVWQNALCTHAANCVHGLPDVFDSQKNPWINAQGATTAEILARLSNVQVRP